MSEDKKYLLTTTGMKTIVRLLYMYLIFLVLIIILSDNSDFNNILFIVIQVFYLSMLEPLYLYYINDVKSDYTPKITEKDIDIEKNLLKIISGVVAILLFLIYILFINGKNIEFQLSSIIYTILLVFSYELYFSMEGFLKKNKYRFINAKRSIINYIFSPIIFSILLFVGLYLYTYFFLSIMTFSFTFIMMVLSGKFLLIEPLLIIRVSNNILTTYPPDISLIAMCIALIFLIIFLFIKTRFKLWIKVLPIVYSYSLLKKFYFWLIYSFKGISSIIKRWHLI